MSTTKTEPVSREESPFLTESEAAARLKTRPKTLTNWRSRRVGPDFIKMNGMVRYEQATIDNWARSRIVRCQSSDLEAA